MKFRKKPVEIEAEQFDSNKPPPEWPKGVEYGTRDIGRYQIETLGGPLAVSDGDWIIMGVTGEKYPCKLDIFEMTYEPVEDDDAKT